MIERQFAEELESVDATAITRINDEEGVEGSRRTSTMAAECRP